MSMLLLVGLVLAGVPFLLIVGFAGFIFVSFMNDDHEAKGIFTVALVFMGIGIALILTHVIGGWVVVN
ncbi:TPA: hypothetical protein DEP96_03800 [Candidatus Uhrbacteria bacterium]|nr:hypothetical protein [Candidatus Uhrbacteria bacterium]